ncbi:Serine/threonine-protein phosphatase, related [Eimeria brunetti]|uniref:Serine/threonine-protein phosphatase, related n=1 Tax=Eimeria brunetti TaxID=51314 RepID=U6LA01_9EIME|nr:Serine/threonine-protein phosphatase, related [Eimeria brunetti]
MTVKVGDKVAVYGYPATVKFVGTFPPSKGRKEGGPPHLSGPVVGIEFHKGGIGNCDGVYHGTRYFQCAPGMGRLVRAYSVKPFSKETCAAIRIQTFYRRHRAAELFQELAAFRFWNALDHFEEKDALVNNRQVDIHLGRVFERNNINTPYGERHCL